jgi:broad specificity phosphatase PhoE
MGNLNSSKNTQILVSAGGAFILSSLFWLRPLLKKLSLKMLDSARHGLRMKRPKRIILIRHGESEANIDRSLYCTIPDNKISLTEKGKSQANEAAEKLKAIIGEESVRFFVSPYKRGLQTHEIITSHLTKNKMQSIVDPRLREQEFGNLGSTDREFVKKMFEERKHVGKFFYRFLNGESGADVYDRANFVIDALFRSFEKAHRFEFENTVLVCHGLFMRLFMMRFFKLSIEKFDLIANPTNCDIWVIERDENGDYKLKTELKEDPTYSD